MCYNITLLPKKATNCVTLLLFMESNVLYYLCVTFALLFKSGLDLFVLKNHIFSNKKTIVMLI